MSKKIKIICTIIGVLCLALSIFGYLCGKAIPAQAQTVKTSVNFKRAKRVKLGTTTLSQTYKEDIHLYVKFKAPRTRKYTFTISNMKSNDLTNGKDYNHGSFAIYKKRKGQLTELNAKTQGGRTYFLEVCAKDAYNLNRPALNDIYSSLPSRSGTVRLKKGQTVWIGYFTTALGKSTCDLTIN